MKSLVMGTAGHIDHGKSALVKALTGIDPDRLKEEKRRGITIELGFAHLDLPDGTRIGIVDVPGHEKFVRTMVAGAGGIDFVLLVIAADEGIMPQTREHLEICRLLGIEHGLIALTKIDLVDRELLELAKEEVADYVRGSFLEGAPLVPFSAVTLEGKDELISAISEVAGRVPDRSPGPFRLNVDRVFTIKGFGTVVTGTTLAGSAAVGDEVMIYPPRLTAKVRGIQVHGESVERATAGQRTALNL
ncbi:MAG TPA: selenocysteine-specific translation elongation factor, partial [Proteobacteria bacterium]|nr:selenocysteine-specific translation elongation factor [Pseudomonadota bacterium]